MLPFVLVAIAAAAPAELALSAAGGTHHAAVGVQVDRVDGGARVGWTGAVAVSGDWGDPVTPWGTEAADGLWVRPVLGARLELPVAGATFVSLGVGVDVLAPVTTVFVLGDRIDDPHLPSQRPGWVSDLALYPPTLLAQWVLTSQLQATVGHRARDGWAIEVGVWPSVAAARPLASGVPVDALAVLSPGARVSVPL